jgi:transposase
MSPSDASGIGLAEGVAPCAAEVLARRAQSVRVLAHAAAAALAGQPAEAMKRFTRFVGLDVHKKKVEACVLDACGQVIHREELACTAAELERFARQHLGPHCAVALEATTNTWAVCNVLRPFCGALKVSNPLKTKAIAQASVKTDKVDAQVLGQLLRCDYLPGVWVPDESTRRLRQVVARRTALVQGRTAVKNRIHSTLAGELIAVPMNKLYDPSGLQWLRQAQMSEQARRFVDSDLRLLEGLESEIALLDQELAAAAQGQARAKLLMTLPGVDYTVAMTLLAALGNIDRFQDGDHAASYLGLTPSTKQSAEHCYHGPITKQGNSHARWMLIEAAQHLDKHPGPLGVFFRRLARKKSRNVAVVATARKLVTIAYLMLKHDEPYRYAQPATVAAKLARLRIKTGGKKRVGGNRKGSGRHPNYGTGKNERRTPGLAQVCQSEGLPTPTPLEQLPAGEQRMLQETGTRQTIESFRRPQTRRRAMGAKHGAGPIAPQASCGSASGAGHPAPSPAPEPPPARGRSPDPLALPLHSLAHGQRQP